MVAFGGPFGRGCVSALSAGSHKQMDKLACILLLSRNKNYTIRGYVRILYVRNPYLFNACFRS